MLLQENEPDISIVGVSKPKASYCVKIINPKSKGGHEVHQWDTTMVFNHVSEIRSHLLKKFQEFIASEESA